MHTTLQFNIHFSWNAEIAKITRDQGYFLSSEGEEGESRRGVVQNKRTIYCYCIRGIVKEIIEDRNDEHHTTAFRSPSRKATIASRENGKSAHETFITHVLLLAPRTFE